MRYIVAYRLRRKNARRKIVMKMEVYNQEKAIKDFNVYINMKNDSDKKIYELLTGNWKHICFYKGDDENGTN